MDTNKIERYTVTTNGSKSYYQVIDNSPSESWESDMCTVWGKREKANRIVQGLNILEALSGLPRSSTKASILEVIEPFLSK